MTRPTNRTGRIQQAILTYLQERGSHAGIWEIAWHIDQQREDAEEYGSPPRSLQVSVRRAVHTLAKAGKVETAHLAYQSHPALAVWLPGQTPPKYQTRRMLGSLVEKVVMMILKQTSEEEVEEWCHHSSTRLEAVYARREPGQVPYTMLVHRTRKAMGETVGAPSRVSVAISRAVRRLHWRYLKHTGREIGYYSRHLRRIRFVTAQGDDMLSVAL